MAVIGEKELRAQLKSGTLSHAYFIYGDEGYLKEHYIGQIKKKAVDPAFADFNIHIYEKDGTQLSDVLHDADTFPMMGGSNLVLVYDFPFDKKADVEDIKAYLKDVPDTTVLVFTYQSLPVDTKKEKRWNSIIKAFAKAGDAVELNTRTQSDLVKMLVSGAKKRGAALQTDQARYLISVVGTDMQTLLHELDKLSAFCKDGEITAAVIDDMATKCLQARVYDLSKFILKGDTGGACKVLHTLFELGEEPIPIAAVLINHYVDMYRVKCAKIDGRRADDIARYYNYKGRDFVLNNAMRDTAKLSVVALRRSMQVLDDLDRALKSTAVDAKILLEEAIVKLSVIAVSGQ